MVMRFLRNWTLLTVIFGEGRTNVFYGAFRTIRNSWMTIAPSPSLPSVTALHVNTQNTLKHAHLYQIELSTVIRAWFQFINNQCYLIKRDSSYHPALRSLCHDVVDERTAVCLYGSAANGRDWHRLRKRKVGTSRGDVIKKLHFIGYSMIKSSPTYRHGDCMKLKDFCFKI